MPKPLSSPASFQHPASSTPLFLPQTNFQHPASSILHSSPALNKHAPAYIGLDSMSMTKVFSQFQVFVNIFVLLNLIGLFTKRPAILAMSICIMSRIQKIVLFGELTRHLVNVERISQDPERVREEILNSESIIEKIEPSMFNNSRQVEELKLRMRDMIRSVRQNEKEPQHAKAEYVSLITTLQELS